MGCIIDIMEKYLILKKDFQALKNNNELLDLNNDVISESDEFLSFKKCSTFYRNNHKLLSASGIQYFLDINKNLSNFKLMVCDMDSTLIQNECIDEIADLKNIKNDIAFITEQTMQGKLTFDQSIKKRVSLLKGIDVSSFEKILNEKIKLQPYALEWCKYVKKFNINTVIISGGFSYFVDHVRNILSMDDSYANNLELCDGFLTGNLVGQVINAQKKAEIVSEISKKHNFSKDEVLSIGDGANDIPMFKVSGLSISMHGKKILSEVVTWNIKDGYFKTLLKLFKHLDKKNAPV
jgi:phosphoserine phosphatase